MSHLLIFGPGYSAGRIADRARAEGWRVTAITRSTIEDDALVRAALASATHILSSVPPDAEGDPVLRRHGDAIAASPAGWVGYLSSTGVYGDSGGAWIDESAPVGGRRANRNAADQAWQRIHAQARVFRLPGIYGPGRSALDRLAEGRAHRIDLPGQVFSRIHVDDIAGGVIASFRAGPPGIYNLADDLPAPQNDLILHAASLIGMPPPPLLLLPDAAALSPEARAFYSENRRVANGKARRLLDWRPLYPDYRAGLRACINPENA
jgi:nucleoside-diphosphate-sugar epimerase